MRSPGSARITVLTAPEDKPLGGRDLAVGISISSCCGSTDWYLFTRSATAFSANSPGDSAHGNYPGFRAGGSARRCVSAVVWAATRTRPAALQRTSPTQGWPRRCPYSAHRPGPLAWPEAWLASRSLGFCLIALLLGRPQSQVDGVTSGAPLRGGPMFLSTEPSKRAGGVGGRGCSGISCCGRWQLAGQSTLRQDLMAER